jgi:hypothetical protein
MLQLPSMDYQRQRCIHKTHSTLSTQINWVECIRSKLHQIPKFIASLTTDAQSPNIVYNYNLYDDQYGDDDYADVQSSDNYDSNVSHTNEIGDTDNVNDNEFQEPFMNVNKPSPKQANASNRFQIMLHDFMMKHRASLQIFDDICNLVIEYTMSPDFSVMTKLPS